MKFREIQPGDLIQIGFGNKTKHMLTVYDVKLEPYGESSTWIYKNHLYLFDIKNCTKMSLWEYEVRDMMMTNSWSYYKVLANDQAGNKEEK